MDDPLRILDFGGADWTMAGLACAAKAAVVLTGAGLLAFGLKKRAAATRHLVWSLGLAGAVLLLPMGLALPNWGLPVLVAKAESSVARSIPASKPGRVELPEAASAVVRKARLDTSEVVARAERSPIQVAAPRRISPEAWLLVLWGAGTMAVLAWFSVGWAAIWRLGRMAEPITDRRWVEEAREAADRIGVAGKVILLRGGAASMPVTWGVLRPVILLPGEADEWPSDRRRAVLMHELAHVHRRDGLTQFLGVAACAVYWFNPMAWWAASRLRTEREQACDDLVLEAGERPSNYAAQLLGVARSLRPSPALSPAAMAMARPSGLEHRLVAILDASRNRRGPARWLVASCLVVVLGASATLAAVRLVARGGERPMVSGQVVGSDGKSAVEGADVVVLLSRLASQYPFKDPAKAEVLGRGRSDARGQFRVEMADVKVTSDDSLLLAATARGSGFALRKLNDLAGPVAEPIRLAPEQPIEVKLVDLEGSPIAGAEVQLKGAYPASGWEGLNSGTLTSEALPELAAVWRSDAAGQFRLRGIGPDQSLALQVRAPGFGSQGLRIDTKANVRTATLTLGRARIVEGRVTLGEGGPPAVGARVHTKSMSSKEGIGMTLGVADATTDADGRYRIEAAPGGGIRVEVYPPREGADAFLLRGRVVVPGDPVTSRADFALPRGILVRGRVREAGTGRAVAGAVVTHQAHERNNPYFIKGNPNYFNGDEREAITANDGTFRLGVMPGPGYLLVKGPTTDYLHEEISAVDLRGELIWPNRRFYPDALRKLDPKPDAGPVEVEFTLRRGETLRGHVVGLNGEPERDAVLFSRWALARYQMTTNYGNFPLVVRGGRFELNGCDPTSSAPALLVDVKKQRGAAVEFVGKQAGKDLEVKLEPCGSATVRFVDGGGKPLRPGSTPAHLEAVITPGASSADSDDDNDLATRKSPLVADIVMGNAIDPDRYRDLKVDKEGRMMFPTLIPGATYRVVVFNQPKKTQIEFTVKSGEAKDLGDLIILNVDQAG